MLKNFSVPFLAFLQATGLAVYLILLSFFFNFVTPIFSNKYEQFYAPIIMLLLFVLSAVICASLFLARAGFLFWEKKYKQSFTLLGWTVGWGIFYLILFLTVFYLKQRFLF